MSIDTRLDLPQRHRRTLEDLIHEHLPGVEVWAYGSRVNGRSHEGSDLDLVLRGPGLEEIPIGQLGDFSDALYESSVPFLVEARDWARLPERFHSEIVRNHVVLLSGEAVDAPIGADQPGWTELSLGHCCTKIGSGATPRGGKEVYMPQGPYALIRSQNILNEGFRDEGLAFIGAAHASQLKNVEVAENDVLVNITGDSVARVCQVRPDVLPARVNQHVAIVRPDPERLDPRFLRYALVSTKMQTKLLSWAASGATRNALTKRMIESLSVVAPRDVGEQRAIANILGTLDDKIELNRRMNETLEAIARALFKSWFVDFEPVRAKMVGRASGLPDDIAELFPSRFTASGKGEIPSGWHIKPLGECFKLTMGQSPPGSSYNDAGDGLPFFQGRTDFAFRYPANRRFCSAPSRIAQSEDTLVSVRAPVGDINMAWAESCIGRGIAALRHYSLSSTYTYYAVNAIHRDIAEFEHSGTVFGAITRRQFESLDVIEPDPATVGAFDMVAGPMDRSIRLNETESRNLTLARDALLPKLVSGEVGVSDAERAIRKTIERPTADA